MTSTTDAAHHTTQYAYDTEENHTSITDTNSNQTAFTYDALGRVTRMNLSSSDRWARFWMILNFGCRTLAIFARVRLFRSTSNCLPQSFQDFPTSTGGVPCV